jgi:hypothetical protein
MRSCGVTRGLQHAWELKRTGSNGSEPRGGKTEPLDICPPSGTRLPTPSLGHITGFIGSKGRSSTTATAGFFLAFFRWLSSPQLPPGCLLPCR